VLSSPTVSDRESDWVFDEERGRGEQGWSAIPWAISFAKPHVEALLAAAAYIEDYATSLGGPLNSRMKFRRKRRLGPAKSL
jgi:hypothetical protein